jgi:hypothetical protein
MVLFSALVGTALPGMAQSEPTRPVATRMGAGMGTPPMHELAPVASTRDQPQDITTALARHEASADARYLGRWIQEHGDNAGMPFAIVDKREARLHLFDEQQRLIGSTVVLVGSAYGDESAPGVGRLAQLAQLSPAERTTPAGRFASEPGRNRNGEDIVWFDYGAALAIHRLRPNAAQERRTQRMASPSPDDNRASLGCVVVPVAFYEQVLRPLLGQRRGVVYVLPETRPVQAWWPAGAATLAHLD